MSQPGDISATKMHLTQQYKKVCVKICVYGTTRTRIAKKITEL
jgi:hypothetical protein